jgi:hypothetical protein
MLLLVYAQLRKLRTVRTGELTGPLQLSRDQERELVRRMTRGGLIARVRPGFYRLPPQLPLGGRWSPDEILALNTLVEDRQGTNRSVGRARSSDTGSMNRSQTVCMRTATVCQANVLSGASR